MEMYRNNTGREHTLAASFNGPGKSFTDRVSLIGYPEDGLWSGTIQVGTPFKAFQGMIFLPAFRSCRLTLGLVQWTLILAAAISSYPHQSVD
jgi:hypothetical protein